MAERYYRAQILLKPEQYQALTEIAQQQDRSISDVVREAVAKYVVDAQANTRKQRALEALEQLAKLREENRRLNGTYQGEISDIIAEARAEREAQMDRVLFGDDWE